MNTEVDTKEVATTTLIFHGQALSVIDARCREREHKVVYLNVIGGHAEQPVSLSKNDKGLRFLEHCASKKERALYIFSSAPHGHALAAVFPEPMDAWTLEFLKKAIAQGAITPETVKEFRPLYYNYDLPN